MNTINHSNYKHSTDYCVSNHSKTTNKPKPEEKPDRPKERGVIGSILEGIVIGITLGLVNDEPPQPAKHPRQHDEHPHMHRSRELQSGNKIDLHA